MSSSSSSTTAVLVAGSALLAVASLAGYGYMSSPRKSSSSSSSSRDLVEIEEEDYITPAEVTKIFDRLFMEMQNIFATLMQQIQQIQMSGQMINEKQLKQLLRVELERALTARQKVILDEFDMDYDCLEEATWEFLDEPDKHPAVVRAVDRFQKFWENATGESVAGYRGGKNATGEGGKLKEIEEEKVEVLSPDRLLEVADKYFQSLTDAMKELVERYKSEGKNLQEASVQQSLNMDFASVANDAGEAALKKEGVSMKQFESSVKAHADNPTVGRQLGMMQMRQQQELMQINSSM